MQKQNSFLSELGRYFTRTFMQGLFTLLPFSLTIGLFMLSFRIILNWLRPVQEFIEHPIHFLNTIPYKAIANQLFLIIVGIFLVGLIIRALVLERLIDRIEALFFKVPLVRPIYSGIKQLIQAFSNQDKITFKKVVLVEFPRDGIYSLGFLTSELPHSIAPITGQKFYNVFIPTTPNPTSGFFVILPEHSFKSIDLTRQEAMAMIISGGIIQPERLTK
jgi:uncharacterized membrane protein